MYWSLGHYIGVDYNLTLCRLHRQLHRQLQHIYHGPSTQCQSRLYAYTPVSDLGFGLWSVKKLNLAPSSPWGGGGGGNIQMIIILACLAPADRLPLHSPLTLTPSSSSQPPPPPASMSTYMYTCFCYRQIDNFLQAY
jgi:hypothetical protein